MVNLPQERAVATVDNYAIRSDPVIPLNFIMLIYKY